MSILHSFVCDYRDIYSRPSMRKTMFAIGLILCAGAAIHLPARQAPSPGPHGNLFSEMRWRNIGPLRAGRTKAIAGVPNQPFTFYFGMVNGGVWKTTNAGRTWTPILNYYLASASSSPVALEILDAAGKLVRHYS